jgi:hypothetical protein
MPPGCQETRNKSHSLAKEATITVPSDTRPTGMETISLLGGTIYLQGGLPAASSLV